MIHEENVRSLAYTRRDPSADVIDPTRFQIVPVPGGYLIDVYFPGRAHIPVIAYVFQPTREGFVRVGFISVPGTFVADPDRVALVTSNHVS